jgi:hypothetical protein
MWGIIVPEASFFANLKLTENVPNAGQTGGRKVEAEPFLRSRFVPMCHFPVQRDFEVQLDAKGPSSNKTIEDE